MEACCGCADVRLAREARHRSGYPPRTVAIGTYPYVSHTHAQKSRTNGIHRVSGRAAQERNTSKHLTYRRPASGLTTKLLAWEAHRSRWRTKGIGRR